MNWLSDSRDPLMRHRDTEQNEIRSNSTSIEEEWIVLSQHLMKS